MKEWSIADAHLQERVFRLAECLELSRDETHIPFTVDARAFSQKRESARQEAEQLLNELQEEGYQINIDDPRQIAVMNDLFLLATYIYPGIWIDHSKED